MTLSSTSRSTRQSVATHFLPNLRKTMLDMGQFPSEYNVIRLASDLRESVPDGDTKQPREIIRELGARYIDCLASYRLKGAVGVQIPAHINLNPHIPYNARGRDLGRRFHADDWTLAVTRLGEWFNGQTGEDIRGFRVADALFDLLLAFPTVEVGAKTPRALAGRLGIAELVGIIADFYGPGSWGRWYPDDVDVDDVNDTDAVVRPNLAGGAFGGAR